MNVVLKLTNTALLIGILVALNKPMLTKELGSPNQSEDLPFSWERYLDPETPEFWDRGNHDGAPPRPMRYVAAYPTEENFQRLQEWHTKRTLYAFKNGGGIARARAKYQDSIKEEDVEKSSTMFLPTESKPEFLIDWNNIEVVYIYRSSCVACQGNTDLLKKLEETGAKVSYLQTDSDQDPLHPNSVSYEGYENYFPHNVTPTYYVKDGGEVMKFTGGLTFAQFKQHIEAFWNKKNPDTKTF